MGRSTQGLEDSATIWHDSILTHPHSLHSCQDPQSIFQEGTLEAYCKLWTWSNNDGSMWVHGDNRWTTLERNVDSEGSWCGYVQPLYLPHIFALNWNLLFKAQFINIQYFFVILSEANPTVENSFPKGWPGRRFIISFRKLNICGRVRLGAASLVSKNCYSMNGRVWQHPWLLQMNPGWWVLLW